MDKLLEFFLYLQGPYAYLAAFLVLLGCGLGIPIPEDITLFTMGILSYYGLADLWVSIGVCLFGVLFGDSLIYFIGRRYGEALTQKGIFKKLLPPDRLAKTREMFAKKGNSVIFAAGFMPRLRAPPSLCRDFAPPPTFQPAYCTFRFESFFSMTELHH